MRIAMVVPSLYNKAPILVARDLAEGLIDKGCYVKVFYFDDSQEVYFPCDVQQISLFSLSKIDGFDIVHCHMIRPDFYGAMCRIFRGRTQLRVTTIHNIVEEDLLFTHGKFLSSVFSKIWRQLWKLFDDRVVLTRQAQNYYHRTQPSCNFTLINNGRAQHARLPITDTDQLLINNFRSEFKVVGACAVVSRRKGLEQVLQTLPFLPNVAFLLIGEGPALNELREEASSLGVQDRFLSLGYRENARDYLQFMDAYVMPSRSEGLPLALLEAAAGSLPIACADIEQLREVFEENEAVFFPLDSPKAMAEALMEILGNSDRYGQAAKAKFDSSFSQSVMVEKYFALYERLLSTGIK